MSFGKETTSFSGIDSELAKINLLHTTGKKVFNEIHTGGDKIDSLFYNE